MKFSSIFIKKSEPIPESSPKFKSVLKGPYTESWLSSAMKLFSRKENMIPSSPPTSYIPPLSAPSNGACSGMLDTYTGQPYVVTGLAENQSDPTKKIKALEEEIEQLEMENQRLEEKCFEMEAIDG